MEMLSRERFSLQAAIDRFQAAGSASFVMLLSTRAGGCGINLMAADTVRGSWRSESHTHTEEFIR